MPRGVTLRLRFVKDKQLYEDLVCKIDERDSWNDISDFLYDCDAVAIQRKDARVLTGSQIKHIISMLLENVEEDGEALIWRKEKNVLYVCLDHKSITYGGRLYRQCFQFIPKAKLQEMWGDEYYKREKRFVGGFKEPVYWKNYDFNGAVTALETLEVRPRIEGLLEEVRNADAKQLPYETALRRMELLSLEEALLGRPFGRDEDLWSYANYLYDSYVESLKDNEGEEKGELSPVEVSEIKKEVDANLASYGFSNTAQIANIIKQTPRLENRFFEWEKRVLASLAEHPKVLRSPIVDSLIVGLFEELQLNYPCIWCGREDVEPNHQGSCSERERLLKL